MNLEFWGKMFLPTIVGVALTVTAAGSLEVIVLLFLGVVQLVFFAYYGLKGLIGAASG